jgi:hypothetical protein
MRQFYHHTILSAESFLHTVAANSAWCATAIWNNHRFENWHKGHGCQCAHRTVDWCGCSPLTLRSSDVPGVLKSTGPPGFRWHVRKVDPRIDARAINLLDGVEGTSGGWGHTHKSGLRAPDDGFRNHLCVLYL